MSSLNKKHLFLYKSKVILLGSLIFLAGCTRVPANSSPSSTVTGVVEVHFIDTGNSDSILIKECKKAMLIDGGDTDDDHDLVNYLEQQGVTELEYVVASHPHADHIGGLDSIIKNFPIRYLFVANGDAETKTYQSFIQAAMDKALTPSVPLEGKQFKLENSYFEVFNTNGGSTTNEASLVLRLTNGEDTFLFTGDAEKETELEILDHMTDVDLLKVGHHGSHSSTTDAFLSKLQPEYAVILASNPNKYGHPHIETIEKLEKAQIEVHRSDECGNIVFISTGNGLQTDCPIGSYNRGAQEGKDTSTSSAKPTPTAKPTTPQVQTPTVYWTPNGKSYHTTKDCSALAKSKTILSGTQVESSKTDPCDRCHSK
ncbi:MAG: ComEC/Rec2 family competence protein [Niameybacter sp.]